MKLFDRLETNCVWSPGRSLIMFLEKKNNKPLCLLYLMLLTRLFQFSMENTITLELKFRSLGRRKAQGNDD